MVDARIACRCGAAIVCGLYPEAAVAAARVPWVVGGRWFRQTGGRPTTQVAPSAPPLSGRYRFFAERERLALLRRALPQSVRREAPHILREQHSS